MEKEKAFHKDGYNQLSGIIIVIGIISYFIALRQLSVEENTFFNRYQIFEISISMIGFVVTIVQLVKVNSNAKVYKETFHFAINEYKNNEFIATISMAIQQVDVIKRLFELEKYSETRVNLALLNSCLTKLTMSTKANNSKAELERFGSFVASLELDVLSRIDFSQRDVIREKFQLLIQLETLLISIESNLKTPGNLY